MNSWKAKSVVLDMTFGSKLEYDRFTRDLRRDGAIEENVLRGRIASGKTWMRLELRGASRRIEELLGRWGGFIVAGAGEPELVA